MAVRRYRCAACGNITRFDVTSVRRTRAFHHFTVAGALVVEEEEVLAESVEDVSCRWCGHGRAVETLGDEPLPVPENLVSVPVRRLPRPAAEVEGTDASGDRVRVRLDDAAPPTLLLFLSTECEGCDELWSACSEPGRFGLGGDGRVVAVTRGDGTEQAEQAERMPELVAHSHEAGPDRPVVASATAWRDYGVLGAPFYVLVDHAMVTTEGVPLSVDQVRSDVERARSSSGPAA